MPLYDYQCEHCHTRFEVRATFQEKDHGLKPICPECQCIDTRQLLSSGMFLKTGGSDGADLSSSCCNPNARPGCCGG
jgi:putative FmdB family regulatory protein